MPYFISISLEIKLLKFIRRKGKNNTGKWVLKEDIKSEFYNISKEKLDSELHYLVDKKFVRNDLPANPRYRITREGEKYLEREVQKDYMRIVIIVGAIGSIAVPIFLELF